MSEEDAPTRRRWVVAMLVILPAWLFVSAGLGLWKYYADSKNSAEIEPTKFATPIDADQLADDMRKLVEIVGPREVGSEAGARGLRRAAAMIQGALGPGNAGYRVEVEGGIPTPTGEWPVLIATLRGTAEGDEAPLVVVVGYDSPGQDPQAASTSVVSVLAVARTLAGENPARALSFVFVPHVRDAKAPVMAILEKTVGLLAEPDLVLVVGPMGYASRIRVSSRDSEVLARLVFAKHGKVVDATAGAPGDDFDLSSVLFEMGWPTVGITTLESEGGTYDAAAHLEATRRLAELLIELGQSSPGAE